MKQRLELKQHLGAPEIEVGRTRLGALEIRLLHDDGLFMAMLKGPCAPWMIVPLYDVESKDQAIALIQECVQNMGLLLHPAKCN